MVDFLPFARPDIGQDEIDEVVHTLQSGWLTTGPQTRRFESDFAAYIGRKHAIAVNSATAGLHLALEAIGIAEGDKVITTVYTFTASAEVIRYFNATPVFVDIDPITKNISVAALKQALAQHRGEVKAIIPVHFGGLACDMDELLQCAAEHGASVLEDAAHALPTTYHQKLVGSFGDMAVFSFYATKTLATGEGGMIVTNNDAWANRIRTMRLHGINRDVFDRYSSSKPSWFYEVVAPGYKYNLTDVASAIGIHQLKKLDMMQGQREHIATVYREQFADLPLDLPYADPNERHSWHLFTIQLQTGRLSIDRDAFVEKLMGLGIGTSVHFIPLHRHPYWRDTYDLRDDDFPVATDVYRRTLSLPIYSAMTPEQTERVVQAVRRVCHDHSH